ncbi:MAG: rhodanese-like domain-containing protein [Pseudomonadota bacterium]
MSIAPPPVDEIDPTEAYEILRDDPSSALVDVRTRAEWTFVGLPDIAATGRPMWLVEWVSYPQMSPDPAFADRLESQIEGDMPDRFLFICRSGGRSLFAAQTVAQAMAARGKAVHCTNVAEGFEGDLDAAGHRGTSGGWKARGLPWRQS